MIGRVYACTPQGPDAEDAQTKQECQKTLTETLTTDSKSWYGYTEYTFAKLINKWFCCCCRNYKWHRNRTQRYEIFVEARKRLVQELSLHHFLSTMRLTDFIADLLDIQNYQKLLINKSRDYQIKQLNDSTKKNSSLLDTADFSQNLVEQLDEAQFIQRQSRQSYFNSMSRPLRQTKLNAQYFEAGLLKENERNVEWLLEQLRPESSRRDRLLLRSITGFDYAHSDKNAHNIQDD